MRRIMTSFKTIILLCALSCVPAAFAQVKRIQDNKKETRSDEMSVRARSFLESSAPAAADAQWSRVIYRELDLTQGSNASLYFPEEPMEGQTNLFRLMINLMAEGKVKGYEYLDGRELFTEKYELQVKDLFDKFHILYEEQAARGKSPARFVIDESDIPCNEVLSFYIKERWSFDQRGSMLFSTIEAICPILHRTGDFGGEVTKYPMFWMPYESIRPYLTQYQVMSEGINNTPRYTFDDFFVMRKYDGKIYKTLNLQNKSLMQLYPHPDSLKMAQEKIEKELVDFRQALWVEKPSEATATTEKNAAKATKANNMESEEMIVEKPSRTSVRSNPRTKTKTEDSNSRTEKAPAANNAPVRSVRRTR